MERLFLGLRYLSWKVGGDFTLTPRLSAAPARLGPSPVVIGLPTARSSCLGRRASDTSCETSLPPARPSEQESGLWGETSPNPRKTSPRRQDDSSGGGGAGLGWRSRVDLLQGQSRRPLIVFWLRPCWRCRTSLLTTARDGVFLLFKGFPLYYPGDGVFLEQ